MIKTCDEYVLNELNETKKALQVANAKIVELTTPKEEATELKDMKCIYLDDKPNYYYRVWTKSAYDWNGILKESKQTPELVEKALTDDESLITLCNSHSSRSCYNYIGKVEECKYDYLLKTRNGTPVVIEINSYNNDIDIRTINSEYDNTSNFLNKELATQYMLKEIRDDINYYLKNYKDKFYEGDK